MLLPGRAGRSTAGRGVEGSESRGEGGMGRTRAARAPHTTGLYGVKGDADATKAPSVVRFSIVRFVALQQLSCFTVCHILQRPAVPRL